MIISKTPFRMSFFGGGTDFPEYFNEFGGSVISTTFDKYVYVTVRNLPRFFDYSTEIIYSKQERVKSIDDINHPMVRNVLKYLSLNNIHISYDADLPAKSGLGSSSTFAVGLLNACYHLKNECYSSEKLANDAIYVERILCDEAGGWQDQIAAAVGGFNRIDFEHNSFSVKPINISSNRKNELNSNLMMFFTGFTRFSADIHGNKTTSNEERSNKLKMIKNLVNKAQEILENDSIELNEFGKLLNEEWKLKKSTSSKVSNSKINELYRLAIENGAIGGKLLGAGGGGFLLFYVPKNKQDSVRKSLKLLEVPFRFEDKGTQIIYNSPEI